MDYSKLLGSMRANGMTQSIVAQKIGVSPTTLNKKLRGQPGIESITKQYLYQLAYQPFVEAHQIGTVRNCFLMPTSSAEIVEKGTVSLDMLSKLGLQDIQIRLLPAQTMYRHYIENTKMDIRTLNL